MTIVLPERFGWVGLGAMGGPMAKRLLMNNSATLVIYDRDQSMMQRFVGDAQGGRVEIASSAREVAEKSECIFTIVPEGSHVKEVYLTSETGCLLRTRQENYLSIGTSGGNTLRVLPQTTAEHFSYSSTIDLASSIAVGDTVMKTDAEGAAQFYDCPVSGGTAGASKGIITFMIHKSDGREGLGLAAKLSNNYLSGIIALATSEAMNLGMRLGIDAKVLSNCLDNGSAANWVNSTVNPVPGVCPDAVTSRNYEGGFKVQLMEKDMRLAIEAARKVAAKLVLGDTAVGAYSAAASDPSYRDKDSRVVYKWLGGVDPRVDLLKLGNNTG
ncbi:6-phosphogluconate dehydrogenase [Mycena sp. CBHHK59/15]|nr:6-phosphogluconate dehydrogenase [Mycena sp. CBHHK59/15]